MFHHKLTVSVTPMMVRRLVEGGAILLDVRTHYEYAGYHVQGAINIPYDEIERFQNFIVSWNKPVITFSLHGRRSEIAAIKLRGLGVEVYDAKTIYVVEEGVRESAFGIERLMENDRLT